MTLDAFIENKNIRNVWIQEHGIDVYVRKSLRMLDAKTPTATPCLDIGSVEVDEDHRGEGIFKAFLKRFEKEAKKLNRAVYVESILNPRLQKFLETQGYAVVRNSSELSPNMFKFPA